MRVEDLSMEDLELLNTDLGDFDKIAADEVSLANEMYETGFSKLATETADHLDEVMMAQKEAAEKEKEEEEEEEDKETEKKASDLSAFIERGFFDGLMKIGSERHGDEMHYLYPFIEEKIAGKAAAKAAEGALSKFWKSTKGKVSEGVSSAKDVASKGYAAAKDKGGKAVDAVKGYHTGAYGQASKGVKGLKSAYNAPAKTKAEQAARKQKLIAGAKNVAKGTGKLVAPYAGAGAVGYGAKKVYDHANRSPEY